MWGSRGEEEGGETKREYIQTDDVQERGNWAEGPCWWKGGMEGIRNTTHGRRGVWGGGGGGRCLSFMDIDFVLFFFCFEKESEQLELELTPNGCWFLFTRRGSTNKQTNKLHPNQIYGILVLRR